MSKLPEIQGKDLLQIMQVLSVPIHRRGVEVQKILSTETVPLNSLLVKLGTQKTAEWIDSIPEPTEKEIESLRTLVAAMKVNSADPKDSTKPADPRMVFEGQVNQENLVKFLKKNATEVRDATCYFLGDYIIRNADDKKLPVGSRFKDIKNEEDLKEAKEKEAEGKGKIVEREKVRKTPDGKFEKVKVTSFEEKTLKPKVNDKDTELQPSMTGFLSLIGKNQSPNDLLLEVKGKATAPMPIEDIKDVTMKDLSELLIEIIKHKNYDDKEFNGRPLDNSGHVELIDGIKKNTITPQPAPAAAQDKPKEGGMLGTNPLLLMANANSKFTGVDVATRG